METYFFWNKIIMEIVEIIDSTSFKKNNILEIIESSRNTFFLE